VRDHCYLAEAPQHLSGRRAWFAKCSRFHPQVDCRRSALILLFKKKPCEVAAVYHGPVETKFEAATLYEWASQTDGMAVLLGSTGVMLFGSRKVTGPGLRTALPLDRQRAMDLLRPYQSDLRTIRELRALLGKLPTLAKTFYPGTGAEA
jgi:hypothetical protein